jgi:uncharacterized protein
MPLLHDQEKPIFFAEGGRMSGLMWRWLVLFALAMPTSASGKPVANLYQGQAVVTGRGEAERARGLGLCLEEVLVKVSGDPRLLGDPRLAPRQAEAAGLVRDFQDSDLYGANRQKHDEQGTRDRPYRMFVTFDGAAIDAMLNDLGRQPWTADRPELAVILAVQDIATGYLLSADGSDGPGQREALAAAAEKRGIPVVLPSAATLAAARLTVGGVSRLNFTGAEAAAQASGAELPLVGRLVRPAPARPWNVDWYLTVDRKMHHWRVQGLSFDEAFRKGIEGAEQILSGHGAPPPLR